MLIVGALLARLVAVLVVGVVSRLWLVAAGYGFALGVARGSTRLGSGGDLALLVTIAVASLAGLQPGFVLVGALALLLAGVVLLAIGLEPRGAS